MSLPVEAVNEMVYRPAKHVKRDREREKYIESHELSMLHLLVRKYPEKAIEIGEKELLTNPAR